MDEKRRHARLGEARDVWIGQDGIFSRTSERIANISVGGVFIETPQCFPKSSIISLRFGIGKSNAMISCSAIVRNTNPNGMGLEFLDITPESQRVIEATIAAAGPH